MSAAARHLRVSDSYLVIVDGVPLKRLERAYIERVLQVGASLPSGGTVLAITFNEHTGVCEVMTGD